MRKLNINMDKKFFIIFILVSIAAYLTIHYLTFYYTTPRALRIMEGEFYLYSIFISNFVISLLFGFNMSIILQKTSVKNKISRESSLSGGGFLAGLLASGCPVCGSLFLPLIGVSGGLAAFPFRGLELKGFAIFLMGLSTYFVVKNGIKCEACF